MTQAAPAARPLRRDTHSVVEPHSDSALLRVEHWSEELAKLGVELPGFVVHDFGLLLAIPSEQLALAPAASSATEPNDARYRALVLEFAKSEACANAKSLGPDDSMVVALLARLLGRPARECAPYRHDPQRFAREIIDQLTKQRLYLLTLADSLDVDTLRLVGMLGGDLSTGSLGVVDLIASLGSPETNAMVQFSLQILPGVLEAKRKPAASAHAAFGYAGLARRGSIDSLVLTELVWDEAELTRRLLENEVLYYSREQGQQETRRLHHLLIDASASMRGQRATFARAIALGTAKKLLLAGDDVTLRFFDSRLYEAHRCQGGKIPVTHLLSFRGERGRNPRRVFHDLANHLEVVSRGDGREQVIQVFTHAGLYIPRGHVERLRRMASLLAVFLLPSRGKLELGYIDLLDHHWVVDESALRGGKEQADAAERILNEVSTAAAPYSRDAR
ncbi:MAG TPA: hypothetical protein VFU02_17075 [Polyangiaceae bacterium]|nr:hypothetical protein [Polyangiaceae bacterium]